MSDRQTPPSVMDRARACILEHRGERFFARIFMPEIDVRILADEVQPDSLTDLGRERRRLTPAEHRDKVVSAARKGELYLWGVQVVIDDETPEIRCDAASQSPMKSRLHALADAHASIVWPDGTVGGISRDPLPFWKNCEGAARGAEECRADQHAGVANSVQAAQGCRLAAGVSMKRADLCPLGTADVAAALDWLEGPEPTGLPSADVFLHRPLFLRMMQLHGVDPASLPRENGQRYWDWVGGGIRYWDGWREMPHG